MRELMGDTPLHPHPPAPPRAVLTRPGGRWGGRSNPGGGDAARSRAAVPSDAGRLWSLALGTAAEGKSLEAERAEGEGLWWAVESLRFEQEIQIPGRETGEVRKDEGARMPPKQVNNSIFAVRKPGIRRDADHHQGSPGAAGSRRRSTSPGTQHPGHGQEEGVSWWGSIITWVTRALKYFGDHWECRARLQGHPHPACSAYGFGTCSPSPPRQPAAGSATARVPCADAPKPAQKKGF